MGVKLIWNSSSHTWCVCSKAPNQQTRLTCVFVFTKIYSTPCWAFQFTIIQVHNNWHEKCPSAAANKKYATHSLLTNSKHNNSFPISILRLISSPYLFPQSKWDVWHHKKPFSLKILILRRTFSLLAKWYQNVRKFLWSRYFTKTSILRVQKIVQNLRKSIKVQIIA